MAWCDESLAIAREIGDGFGGGNALLILGHVALAQGDLERAQALQEGALAAWRPLCDTLPKSVSSITAVLANLAQVAIAQGDDTRAVSLAEEALSLQRESGWSWGAAESLYFLAATAHNRGEARAAAAYLGESLLLAWEQRDRRLMLRALDHLAILAQERGEAERAARLFGAAARMRELLALELVPNLQPMHDRVVSAARDRLGADGFQAAWAAGWALSQPEVVAEASSSQQSLALEASPIPKAQVRLSRRERDVLRLLVVGKSDREIAEALFIGHRTVETHVRGILNKLGLSSRTAVAAHAVRHGLV